MAEWKASLESRIGELTERKARLEKLCREAQDKYNYYLGNGPAEPDTTDIDKRMDALRTDLAVAKEAASTDNSERISALQGEINELNAQLAKREIMENAKQTIDTYRADNVKLMNSEAELIRQKAQLDEFSIKEIELAAEVINSSFNGVKFNFLAELGGSSEQGVRKTCVATYQGIEYDKLSGGQQIICDYLVSKSLRVINGWHYPQWTDEVCRVSNTIDRLREVFDFDLNEWQNIVLLTDDYAKLPVTYIKA